VSIVRYITSGTSPMVTSPPPDSVQHLYKILFLLDSGGTLYRISFLLDSGVTTHVANLQHSESLGAPLRVNPLTHYRDRFLQDCNNSWSTGSKSASENKKWTRSV